MNHLATCDAILRAPLISGSPNDVDHAPTPIFFSEMPANFVQPGQFDKAPIGDLIPGRDFEIADLPAPDKLVPYVAVCWACDGPAAAVTAMMRMRLERHQPHQR